RRRTTIRRWATRARSTSSDPNARRIAGGAGLYAERGAAQLRDRCSIVLAQRRGEGPATVRAGSGATASRENATGLEGAGLGTSDARRSLMRQAEIASTGNIDPWIERHRPRP